VSTVRTVDNIQEGFQMLLHNQKTFEQIQDHIRRALELEDYNYFCFGSFTSLLTLWDHILRTPQTVHRTYCQCENGHKHQIQNTSAAYTPGRGLFCSVQNCCRIYCKTIKICT